MPRKKTATNLDSLTAPLSPRRRNNRPRPRSAKRTAAVELLEPRNLLNAVPPQVYIHQDNSSEGYGEVESSVQERGRLQP